MLSLPRYSHRRHTGRLRPHHETSYGWLVAMTMLVGGLLGLMSFDGASASGPSAPPVTGSYSVFAVVPAPKVTTAPVITSPSNGQSFTTNPVTVAGTCPANTLVKVFKNGILAGSVVCAANRQFSLPIDLVIGTNALTATAFNVNDESGPTSNVVNVTLNAPPGGLGFSTELLIQSTTYYQGTAPGIKITWPIELVGGQAPYAISFSWGDGATDLLTRTAPGPFTLNHTYTKPGGYLGAFPLIIRATDAAGHTAYLQVTTIVNNPKGAAATTGGGGKPSVWTVFVLWPFWLLLLLVILAFWLGEWREKRKLRRKIEALATA